MKANVYLAEWFMRSVARVPPRQTVPKWARIVVAFLRPWWWFSKKAAAKTLGLDWMTDSISIGGHSVALNVLESLSKVKYVCSRHHGVLVGVIEGECPWCAAEEAR